MPSLAVSVHVCTTIHAIKLGKSEAHPSYMENVYIHVTGDTQTKPSFGHGQAVAQIHAFTVLLYKATLFTCLLSNALPESLPLR